MRSWCFLFLFASVSSAGEWPRELAKPIRELVPQTAQVCRFDRQEIHLWLLDQPTPTTAKQTIWASGALIGVIQLKQPWIDFRGQEIVAGAYTLRYAQQPQSADHEDTASSPHFLVLSPLAKDSDPKPIPLKELYARSRLVSGGTHPAVMAILPPMERPVTLPKSWRTTAYSWKHDGKTHSVTIVIDGVWNGK